MNNTPNAKRRRYPHLAAVALSGALTVLATPGGANAASGATIASAPVVQYGVAQAGGGRGAEFWKLLTYGGDRLHFQWTSQDVYCPRAISTTQA